MRDFDRNTGNSLSSFAFPLWLWLLIAFDALIRHSILKLKGTAPML